MFSVSREFSFSYGHRLYRYDGRCRRLHGHNALVMIEILEEGLDEQGMAMDFVKVKSTVGKWIDESLDHRVFGERRSSRRSFASRRGGADSL